MICLFVLDKIGEVEPLVEPNITRISNRFAEEMGYKNDKVAKKKKYECLKKLKSMVENAGYTAGDLLGS